MHSADTPLPAYHIRPRFRVESQHAPEEVISRIKKALREEGAACEGYTSVGFATLTIPAAQRHYWSPQLTVSVEALEDGSGSLIRGLYGPAPAVWTMFVFFYSFIGFSLVAVLIAGFSYMSLGIPSALLWWAPVLAAVLLSLFLVSFFGQKLGREQMIILHDFLEETLGHGIGADNA